MQVSVCIPVFNRRDLVGHALRSALAQDVPHYEVIVVDNCSTDGTWEYLKTFSDRRLTLYRNDTNVGLYGNFNRCGQLATGAKILFLCSDDRLSPGFISSAKAQMDAAPSAVLLSSRGRLVDYRGRPKGYTGHYFHPGVFQGHSATVATLWTMLWAGVNPFNYPSGTLFRADALKSELPFRDLFGTPADIDLYLRILQHGNLIVSREIGCEIVGHPDQFSSRAKRSGAFIDEMLYFLESRRSVLADMGLYEKFNAQLGASVLAHVARVGMSRPLPQISILTAISALVARLSVRSLWRIGRQPIPYLRRLEQP